MKQKPKKKVSELPFFSSRRIPALVGRCACSERLDTIDFARLHRLHVLSVLQIAYLGHKLLHFLHALGLDVQLGLRLSGLLSPNELGDDRKDSSHIDALTIAAKVSMEGQSGED